MSKGASDQDRMTPEEFWRPFEVSITSYQQLLENIESVMKKAASRNIQFAWRGQSDASWALHSSLYRRLNLTKGKICKEEDVAKEEHETLVELHRWGLHSSREMGRLSILNQLAMLQHYGAPTRLIDITFNAWVGVWFAVEEKWKNGVKDLEDKDARLFAFDITERLINESEQRRPWEDSYGRPWKEQTTTDLNEVDAKRELERRREWTTSVFAWKPANLDARIAAQNGGFLFGGVPATTKPNGSKFQFPKSPVNEEGLWGIEEGRKACCLALRPHAFSTGAGQRANSGALYTFRIAAAAKPEIRQRLERLFGYCHSSIYPDFTGFATFGRPALRSY